MLSRCVLLCSLMLPGLAMAQVGPDTPVKALARDQMRLQRHLLNPPGSVARPSGPVAVQAPVAPLIKATIPPSAPAASAGLPSPTLQESGPVVAPGVPPAAARPSSVEASLPPVAPTAPIPTTGAASATPAETPRPTAAKAADATISGPLAPSQATPPPEVSPPPPPAPAAPPPPRKLKVDL
jgi:hypothetical protein